MSTSDRDDQAAAAEPMPAAEQTGHPDAGASAFANPKKSGGLSRRNITWITVTVLLVLVLALMSIIKVPVAILRPGPATNTLGKVDGKEVIQIVGGKSYPTSGALDFTTVSLAGGPNYPVSVLDYLKARFFEDDAQIDPEEAWFPKDVSGKEIQQRNAADMVDSQKTAEAVATRMAGFPVKERILVGMIAEGAPAAGTLKVNDRLLEVAGKPVTNLASVHNAMATVKPGDAVPVKLIRGSQTITVQAKTVKADGSDRAVFGIGLNPQYDLPFTVQVNAGNVGGPSAGMMFTLAIYDKITPGPLTGGKRVAGTGSISEDGAVGPIGGVRHKMKGAKSAGATYFLAPESDCNEVVGHEPKGLTVIKVSTVKQAVDLMPKIARGETTGFPACTK